MLAPEQAPWKALTQEDIAFCCAVDPDAVSVPFAHCDAAGFGALAELELVLLSLPQAVSVSAAATTNVPAPTNLWGPNTGTVLLLLRRRSSGLRPRRVHSPSQTLGRRSERRPSPG